jgi:hypothetical protein
VPPTKSSNSNPLVEGREIIGSTTRCLQGATYLIYPSLRKIAGAPEEKTNLKHQQQGNKRSKP